MRTKQHNNEEEEEEEEEVEKQHTYTHTQILVHNSVSQYSKDNAKLTNNVGGGVIAQLTAVVLGVIHTYISIVDLQRVEQDAAK